MQIASKISMILPWNQSSRSFLFKTFLWLVTRIPLFHFFYIRHNDCLLCVVFLKYGFLLLMRSPFLIEGVHTNLRFQFTYTALEFIVMVTHTLTCLPLKMRTLMFLTKLFICLHTGCLWCVEHNGRSDRYFDLGVKGQSFVCLI